MALSNFFSNLFDKATKNPTGSNTAYSSPDWLTNSFNTMFAPGPGPVQQMTGITQPQTTSYSQNFVGPQLNPSAVQQANQPMTPGNLNFQPLTGPTGMIANPPTAQQQQPVQQQGGGLGGGAAFNIPGLEDQNMISGLAGAANDGRISTFTPSDLRDGQKTKYQQLLEEALNYYLGYDTSKEAKRMAQLQQQLGNLQGAYRQSQAQIETTPGLTSFQAGRRQQALAQSAGGVIDPIQAELEILQGQQTGREARMKNALGIAEMLKPQQIGEMQIDSNGIGTIVNQDPMSGSYYTVNLGKVGSAKPASTDIAEYEYARQNSGFSGSFLQFLAAKTSATTKASGGGGGSSQLAQLAEAVMANPAILNTLTPTLRGQLIPLLYSAGFRDFGKSLSDGALTKISDTESGLLQIASIGESIQALGTPYTGIGAGFLAAIPGTAQQKLQADLDRVKQVVGKALEGGVLRKEDEEKYKKILPTVGDTAAIISYKIAALDKQLRADLSTYIANQSGAGRSTSSLPPTPGMVSQYVVGQSYRNSKGEVRTYQADGTFK